MPVLRIERTRYVVMRRNRTEIWCGLSREFHFVKVEPAILPEKGGITGFSCVD